MNIQRWRPDRTVEHGVLWVVLDVVVAYLSAVIAIGPSDFTASVLEGSLLLRVAAVTWFVAIVARRFFPAAALWAAAAATTAVALSGDPVTNASLASALALTLVLQSRPPRIALELSVLPVVVVAAALVAQPDALVPAAIVHVVALTVGRASRVRWEAAEALRLREIEHERERAAERTRQALTAERARMARELHDAVGHAVTVMVTHAGAARLALGDGHVEVAEALGRIERVGRGAMTDLDGILGLLEPNGDGGGGAGEGSNDDVGVGATGDRGEGTSEGTVDDTDVAAALRALVASLPPGVSADLRLPDDSAVLAGLDREVAQTVRRVAQEALTNVIRHARPAHADVEVAVEPYDGRSPWLLVTVSDDGRSGGSSAVSGGGRGLAGMRERVAALDGECEAGPVPSGGWRVRARIPARRAAPAEEEGT